MNVRPIEDFISPEMRCQHLITKGIHVKMKESPTTEEYDDNDCELPSITVTRDSADVLDTEDFLYSLDDTEVHHNFPVTTAEDVSIFPESLFNAARYV